MKLRIHMAQKKIQMLAGLMSMIAVAATAAETNTEAGLVLRWGFDDVGAQTIKDLSGSGNDGRIEGKVTWIAGVQGNAMQFDGDAGFAWRDNNAALNPSNLTVMLWLAPDEWNIGNTLIDKGWDQGWGIDPHYYGNKIHFCANIGGKRVDVQANQDIPLKKWSHLAVTYDGEKVAMYVNGERKETITGRVSEGSVVGGKIGKGLKSSSRLRVGGMTPECMCVDDVRLYNRALGNDEIKNIFAAVNQEQRSRVNKTILGDNSPVKSICENLTIDDIPLIKGRKANGIIVLDARAPETTAYAARELNRYLRKMFSVELPVLLVDERTDRDAAQLAGRNLILVGVSRISKALGFDDAALKPDGFLIAATNNALAIVGRDYAKARMGTSSGIAAGSAGTLYGIYRLLEDMGVRWYFPGAIGEVLPERKTVMLENLNLTDAPYFIYREAGGGIWKRRMGFGGVANPAYTCHSFNTWSARYSKDHPEYFAVRADGTRELKDPSSPMNELCWYAPAVRAQMIKDAETFFAGADAVIYPDFTFMRCDGAQACCACPECQKRRTPEEGFYGEFSDYVTEAAIEAAAATRTNYPDRRIVIGAYEQITRPPVKIKKLPENVSVHIFKHRHLLWDAESRERLYDEVIGGWLKLKPQTVSFWEYYNFDEWGPGWNGVPGFAPHMIAADIRKLKEISEKSGTPFLGEMIFCGGNKGCGEEKRLYWLAPALYVTAKLLWHPDTSVDALLDDFYAKYFGPAAPAMKKFYSRLEQVWSAGNWRKNYYAARLKMDEIKKDATKYEKNPWQVAFTTEVLKEACAYLTEARGLASGEPYKGRVKHIAECFDFVLQQSAKDGGAKVSIDELEKALKYYGGE